VLGVSKRFRRGAPAYGTLRDRIAALWRRGARPVLDVPALCGVDLEAARGEVVGIVGRNGAGKSTLLKVVARITPPDAGRVEVRGRVSSLIEVGAGFHPELTGAENVLLHGAILGVPRRTLRALTPEIASFAGVEDALHTPVKHFSTGMYARLGFAVAVHARPDLLLVDEVYAVGDEEFRARCVDRVRALAEGGTAILVVTHDLEALGRLADRAVWIEAGRVERDGGVGEVVRAYRTALGGAAAREPGA
jgi:ABC-type polysaccharide/polyol phosphate transport system ATPase subunit